MKPALEAETPIRAMDLPEDEARVLRGFTFLSQKPILHCLNLAEKEIDAGVGTRGRASGSPRSRQRPRTRLGWVSAVIEAEVAQLAGPEQAAFLADLGLAEPAITRVLQDCYALLGLLSFFTVGEDEVRAWSIPRGHARPGRRRRDPLRHRARVHPRRGRGLRRADRGRGLDGGGARARPVPPGGQGLLVRDGEICHFRFNVAK